MSRKSGPPVSLPSFSYSPICDLYVEINDTKYSRCGDTTLYDLLNHPPVQQDESKEFYTAQLLHYGLKPQKSVQAAKKMLLAAFQDVGGLAVSENILQLEQELAAEYRDKNAAGKEGDSRKQKPLQKKSNGGETKKRGTNEAELLAAMYAPSHQKSKLNEVCFWEIQ